MPGTLAVLLKARRRGLIAELCPAVGALGRLGFRLADATRRKVLALAGEPD